MKTLRKLSIALSILITCLAAVHAAPLKLHKIFTDHMVIQRDKPIKIWGWAVRHPVGYGRLRTRRHDF